MPGCRMCVSPVNSNIHGGQEDFCHSFTLKHKSPGLSCWYLQAGVEDDWGTLASKALESAEGNRVGYLYGKICLLKSLENY